MRLKKKNEYVCVEINSESNRVGIDWKKWIDRTLKLVYAGIDGYIGFKRKEPIYLMSAASKVSDVVNETLTEREISLAQIMGKHKLERVFANYFIQQFVVCLFDALQLTHTNFPLKNKALAASNVVRKYNLENTTICTVFDKGPVDHEIGTSALIYAENRNIFLEALNREIHKELGANLALRVATKNWDPVLTLAKAPVDDFLETYVSSLDLNEFITTLNKFNNLGYNRSFLLYGPPGTGKTTFAHLVNKRANGTILTVDCSSMNLCIEKNVDLSLFLDLVRPSIILFDDLDRVDNLQLLLGELERLGKEKGKNRTIFSTINSLTAIPPALRRPGRFDEILEFNLPNNCTRIRILRAYLRHFDVNLKSSSVDELAIKTEGLSGAELKEIALQIKVNGYDTNGKIDERCKQMLQMKKLLKPEDEENHLDSFL